MTDKEFFKIMKHESSEYSDDFSDAFPFWVMKIFFLNLSGDDIERVVEGLDHNDESIDGFWVSDETKEINFIQCKSAISEKKRQSCKKEWLSYFYDVPNKLRNLDYISEHRNQRIKDIAADYAIASKKKYKTRFYFFHLGDLPNKDTIINSYNTQEDISFDYYNFEAIKDQWMEHKSRTSQTEPESFEIKLTYSLKPDFINEKMGKHHTLISLITGDQLIKLREQHKYKLFDKNVRFNLGKNKINSGIFDTALNDKSNFYFYNNGITINCRSYKVKDDKNIVKISLPQIINGAQTVDSIYSAYKERVNKLKRELGDQKRAEDKMLEEFSTINVLFRLIQSESHDSDFAMNVITYNNSQNAIQTRDFFANRPEQLELQKRFAKYGYFYEIKRGDRNYIKKNPHNYLGKKLSDFKFSEDKIDIEKLSSLYRAYLGEPSAKEVGAKYILNDTDAYYNLFGHSISDIDEKKVKDMILAYNLFDLLEKESKLYKKILIMLANFEKNNTLFEKLKDLIEKSAIFKSLIKTRFKSLDTYLDNKHRINEKIREYYSFSQGKYQVLAILKLILEKCNYYDTLIKANLFYNKNFIYEKMIKRWISDCLDYLLVPVYKEAVQQESISINTFYLRSKTFQNICNLFEKLEFDKNKEYEELFPLKMTGD